MQEVDDAYLIIDSLNFTADRTPDFNTRDRIRNMAIEKEQSAFYKLTNATNVFLEVNETRYKVYKAHYPKVDEKKMTPEIKKAKSYEKEADEYYLKAKNEIALANKEMYRSEQYIQMMGANDMLLYSIQLQESAYGIYLNIPDAISEKPDTAFITKNKKNKSNIQTVKEKGNKELSWDLTATYTYSKDKPKAVPYKSKNGVIFLVQLGIFKGILPAEKFGTIQPVVFDEFSKNPNRRFMVGEYRSTEAAETALEQIKKMGYSDAYIVSLVDGSRKTYANGKEIVNAKDDHYNHLKRTELAKLSGDKDYVIEDNDEPNKTGYISGKSIKDTKGLVFLVQLGMYLKPVTYEEFKGLQPIYTDKISGKGTRYMLGTYSTLAKARDASQRAIDKGMADAYVIAYYNGEHISLDKAKKIAVKQGTPVENEPLSGSSDVVYMVQVGAYREALTPAEEAKLKSLFAPREVNTKLSEGMNIYMIGEFKTYKEADLLKRKLLDAGHDGVFVVAFQGDTKITVSQAIKLGN